MLGPLEVTADGRSLELAGARTRAVLAMLLVHANQVVSSDRLIEELWPGHPADKAADSLQVRLSELRKALRSAGEAERLVTRPPGYLLRVTPGELDALRFERLAAAGNVALAAGDAVTAASRLDEALGLWRGPALADVDVRAFGAGGGGPTGGRAAGRARIAGRGAAGLRQAPRPHRGAEDAHRGPSAA